MRQEAKREVAKVEQEASEELYEGMNTKEEEKNSRTERLREKTLNT